MKFYFERRFLPLFVTQFFGAFNDNLFKNALVVIYVYNLSRGELVPIAAGVFILPFFLFSASAGVWADKSEKASFIRNIKLIEIIIMLLALALFLIDAPLLQLFVLLLMGIQSAIFGPVKYSMLPSVLSETELVPGNTYFNVATFLAILLGTIMGSLVVTEQGGPRLVGVILVVCAIIGWVAALFIPELKSKLKVKEDERGPEIRIFTAMFRECGKVFVVPYQRNLVIAVSWFWFIGASMLSQLPRLVSENLHANNEVYILFLCIFTIGVGIGGKICNMLFKVPGLWMFVPSLIMLTVGIVLFYFMTILLGSTAQTGEMLNIPGFMADISSWMLLGTLLLISVAAGMMVIPVFSMMQQSASPEERSTTIGVNNIVNALFMVVSAGVMIILDLVGFKIPEIMLIMGLFNIPFLIWWKLQSMK